jgi:hypothetical protein
MFLCCKEIIDFLPSLVALSRKSSWRHVFSTATNVRKARRNSEGILQIVLIKFYFLQNVGFYIYSDCSKWSTLRIASLCLSTNRILNESGNNRRHLDGRAGGGLKQFATSYLP